MTEVSSVALDEPLEDLARFAFDEALQNCQPEHGCGPYHRTWSMIRLLSKAGVLPAGQTYFRPWLSKAARDGKCRVLLSGAADTGLAAMVLHALQPTGIKPEIVLADRCATTLAQNRRYADQIGHRFELHQTDLAALDCDPVDAVLTHSFLHFIPPDGRAGLARAWARVLRPQGYLIGLQRFGSGRDRNQDHIAQSADQLEAAALSYGFEPAKAAEIRRAGVDFWAAKLTHAPMDAEAFQRLLVNAGFQMLEIMSLDKPAVTSPMAMQSGAPLQAQSVFAAQKGSAAPA